MMALQIDILKEGSKAKITVNNNGVINGYTPNLSDVSLSYDATRSVVNIGFIANLFTYNFPSVPAANVTIGGVVPSSQSTFDTQVSTVFPLSDPTSGGGTSSNVTIGDGITPTLKATVAQFHNADNQILAGTANGLLGGGVAQLINPAGNLDRQRGTGTDGIPAVGVATGAAQNAQPFTITHAASTAIGANVVFTPNAISGFTVGAPWSVQVGSVLVLEPTPVGGPVPANQEAVVVTAVTATTFTVKTTKAHTGPFNILGFVYNQSRDATVVDGSSGLGFGAAGTYLWNGTLNSGVGGWERDRSASGELDGATGQGTAVAAEYEYNGGGPGGANYDRARSVQAKVLNSGTITGTVAAGATSLTLSSITGLQAGEQVTIDRGTANKECLYVTSMWNGANPVTFTSATQFAHTNAVMDWDDFGPTGPGLNGFTATGIGIEEEALYNPVDDKFYLERSATQDNMAAPNIVAESPALFNGSTMDRQRGNIDSTIATLSAVSASGVSADQTNYNGRGVKVVINVTAITGTTPSIIATIQGKDAASGAYYNILSSASITAAGATVLEVYPGIANAANSTQGVTLPRTWRVSYAIAGTTPAVTATIGASVIV